MLIYSDPPPGLSHRYECAPTRFAAWKEEKNKRSISQMKAAERKWMIFQKVAKRREMRWQVWEKGFRVRVGWGGLVARPKRILTQWKDEEGERCFYRRGAKSSKIRYEWSSEQGAGISERSRLGGVDWLRVSQRSQREREMARRAPAPSAEKLNRGPAFVLEKIKKEKKKKMNIFERNTVMTEA